MSRHWALKVATLLLLGSCAPTDATLTSDVTISSSASTATTTTSIPSPTTMTTVPEGLFDSDHIYLARVDSATLAPLPGFEGIPMKDEFWGAASLDGEWIGGIAWDYVEPIPKRYMRLVSVEDWEVVLDVPTMHDGPIFVSDDGSIFWIRDVGVRQLQRMSAGMGTPELIGEFPTNFGGFQSLHMTRDRWLYAMGTTGSEQDQPVDALLAGVNVDSGQVKIVNLDGVRLGWARQIGDDIPEGAPFESFLPALVFDDAHNRALVVHADEDVVTEIDLESDTTKAHLYAPQTSLLKSLLVWLVPPAAAKGLTPGTIRTAALSPDGRYLYVATETGAFRVESEGDWSVTTDSVGIEMIDTETWLTVSRLDEPISTMWLSPNGKHLFGFGTHQVESFSSASEPGCSDVYLLDPKDLSEIARFGTDPKCLVSVSFSADGRFAYLLQGSQLQTVDIIDLDSASITMSLRHLGTRSPAGFSLWNLADVMGLPPGKIPTGP